MAKRGRPPLGDGASERVNIRLPQHVYDVVCRESLKHDVPISVILRRAILRVFVAPQKMAPPSP